jgi:hypothetical protein
LHDNSTLKGTIALASEHDCPVRYPEETRDIVRYDNGGGTDPPGKSDKHLVDFLGADRIETGGRLVGENKVGIQRQRARQGNALFHSATDPRRSLRSMLFKADHPEFESRRFKQHRWINTPVMFAKREMHVPEQRKGFYQGPGLKQHSTPDMQFPQLFPLEPMKVLPENADLAGSWLKDPDQYIQESALAASAPAKNDEGLLRIDLETDSVQDGPPVGKYLRQVENFEDRRWLAWNYRFRLSLCHFDCGFAHI